MLGIHCYLIDGKVKRMNDKLRCYECTADGDDYYTDDEGNMVSVCDDCPYNEEGGEAE